MNLAKHLKTMWIFAGSAMAAAFLQLQHLSANEAETTRPPGSSHTAPSKELSDSRLRALQEMPSTSDAAKPSDSPLQQNTPCAEFLSLVRLHSHQLVAAIRTPDSATLKKLFEELHVFDPTEIAAMTAQIKLGALLNASIVQEAIVRAWIHLYPDKSRLISAVKHFKDISKESDRLYLVDLVLAELLCLTPTRVDLSIIGDIEKIAKGMRMTSSAYLEIANHMHQLSQTDLGFYNIRLAIYANLYLAQPELMSGIANRSGAFRLFWIRRDKQRTPRAPTHKSVTSFDQFRKGRSTYFDTAELASYLKRKPRNWQRMC
jgi:hypothetical protein